MQKTVRITIETIDGSGRVEKLAQRWQYARHAVKKPDADKVALEAVHALTTPVGAMDSGE